MPTVTEAPNAEKKIRGVGLWEEYKEAKKKFIVNPNLKSLDFCLWDRKLRVWSFKITKAVRVKMLKRPNNEYVVFSVGDFHRKQAKR